MTAKKISKTVTAATTAATFDAATELGGSPHSYQNLRVTSVNSAGIIAIGWNGVTAAIAGDDVQHIGPFGYIEIPYVATFSYISDTAGLRMQVSGI